MGVGLMGARIGGAITPFVLELHNGFPSVPGVSKCWFAPSRHSPAFLRVRLKTNEIAKKLHVSLINCILMCAKQT